MVKSLQKIPSELRWWLFFPLLFLNGWLLFFLINCLEPLLSIFIIANLLAFLLDIPVKFLQQYHIRRSLAIAFILVITFLLIGLIGLTLIPLLWQQLNYLLNTLPEWILASGEHLKTLDRWAVSQKLSIDWQNIINNFTTDISRQIQVWTSQFLDFVLFTFNTLFRLFLTLILTVFLLLFGKQLWEGILSWLPPWWSNYLRQSIKDKFRRFLGGQILLALILSINLTIIFLLFHVPLALLFGFAIGISSIIPFLSGIVQVLVSLFLMLQNFLLGTKVLIIAIILSQINDNILNPRIMGNIVGLNPVWLLLSILLGFKIFGILGVILAIPTASWFKSTADLIRIKAYEVENK